VFQINKDILYRGMQKKEKFFGRGPEIEFHNNNFPEYCLKQLFNNCFNRDHMYEIILPITIENNKDIF